MLPLPFADDDDHHDSNVIEVDHDIDAERGDTRGRGNASGDSDDDDFFAPSLCRQKSFEGLMGGFLQKAAAKKAVRKQKPSIPQDQRHADGGLGVASGHEPQRGTLGKSKSMEGVDLAAMMLGGGGGGAALGGEQQYVLRGGRRPKRQGDEDEEERGETQD